MLNVILLVLQGTVVCSWCSIFGLRKDFKTRVVQAQSKSCRCYFSPGFVNHKFKPRSGHLCKQELQTFKSLCARRKPVWGKRRSGPIAGLHV